MRLRITFKFVQWLLRLRAHPVHSHLLLLAALSLSACGGGGGGDAAPTRPNTPIVSSEQTSSPASSLISSVSLSSSSAHLSSSSTSITSAASSSSLATSSSLTSSSSAATSINITGRISYDFVPLSVNGLNYEALSSQPARGVLIELVDASNRIITSGVTDAEGRYNLSASLGQNLRVRAKAQLINGVDDAGEWDIRVTDNTSNNRLYAMVGDLLAVSEATAQRNLHAPSGWSGQAYTEPRIAAPFAIIDSVYLGLQRILAANSSVQLSRMEFRWSANNNTASGELSLGEIGTSFYRSDLNAIYVLGAADEDTDEYDRHVILHEWGHYIEAELSRSDSIGGAHSGSDKLDFRVAMSEGFANAFSAMLLDDPLYRDSSGFAQQDGFNIDVERLNNAVRGWYSEDSVQSVVYNFYTSANNKTARNFADVFNTITRSSYINSDAFVSIYLFAEELRAELPTVAPALDTLLTGQNIAVTDRFGAGESNSGGMSRDLPVYKTLQPNNVAVNVCSTNLNGSYNKLGGSQFFRLDILSAGRYQISATESQSNLEDSDPDLYLYRRGQFIAAAESANADSETLTQSLEPGVYVLEVTDARTTDESSSDAITACFDVRLVAN